MQQQLHGERTRKTKKKNDEKMGKVIERDCSQTSSEWK